MQAWSSMAQRLAFVEHGTIALALYRKRKFPLCHWESLCNVLLGRDSGFIGSRVEETEARINRKYRNSLKSL
jgi:hypothetical protein